MRRRPFLWQTKKRRNPGAAMHIFIIAQPYVSGSSAVGDGAYDTLLTCSHVYMLTCSIKDQVPYETLSLDYCDEPFAR
jgi:hypothetical protein